LSSQAAPDGRLRPKHYDYVFRVLQYKFFGPHQGVLYGRYDLLDQLRAYKVRPAEDVPPHKFETGTKNHEGLAGTTAAINYLAESQQKDPALIAGSGYSERDAVAIAARQRPSHLDDGVHVHRLGATLNGERPQALKREAVAPF
jgi:selenocysteine lyase/cysteine desulfurase